MKNIIICGPSAVGKDTVARFLLPILNKENKSFNLVLSNTTRPKRPNEHQDIDYHFCHTHLEFDNYDYLEQTVFRGWRYGVPFQNIKENMNNIFILNPDGIKTALEKLDNCIIVYLYSNFFTRLMRSVRRERRFRFEMLRRGITDSIDFKKFERFCNKNNITYYKIKNFNTVYTACLIHYYLTF